MFNATGSDDDLFPKTDCTTCSAIPDDDDDGGCVAGSRVPGSEFCPGECYCPAQRAGNCAACPAPAPTPPTPAPSVYHCVSNKCVKSSGGGVSEKTCKSVCGH